ncbi:hypothetical protein JB92DRAFT_2915681 [Gautieria morchelliformis]|nr:hypothetical protein JB92DRAFT_2915681 [Gautieria morchelliformis]
MIAGPGSATESFDKSCAAGSFRWNVSIGLEVSCGHLRLPPARLLPGRRRSRSRFHASPAVSCAAQTIRDYPSLFKVTMAIHVSHFEFLLSSHPLVASLQFANVGESAPITFAGSRHL